MNVLLKIVAIILVLIAAGLIYAVIAALTSDGGARAGVAIGYVVGSLVLLFIASMLWKRSAGGTRTGTV